MARKRPVRAATRHRRAKLLGLALMGGYSRQLEQQGGGCAICGKPPKVRRLNVDHAHLSGEVRGLLCARCNRGLGWFSDSAQLCFTAATYLRYGWAAAVVYRDVCAGKKDTSRYTTAAVPIRDARGQARGEESSDE